MWQLYNGGELYIGVYGDADELLEDKLDEEGLTKALDTSDTQKEIKAFLEDSSNVLVQLSFILTLLFVLGILMLIVLLLVKFVARCLPKSMKKVLLIMRNELMFNFVIRTLILVYLNMAVKACLAMRKNHIS